MRAVWPSASLATMTLASSELDVAAALDVGALGVRVAGRGFGRCAIGPVRGGRVRVGAVSAVFRDERFAESEHHAVMPLGRARPLRPWNVGRAQGA